MKIAMVAMSGIRVCDAELLQLGLTLPGFVERSKTIASLPSLGLLTLAGMTPGSHKVAYFECPQLDALDDSRLRLEDFDAVAISSYSAQIDEAYALADRCRERGVTAIVGGLHATALPDEALEHCDTVVVGEGEACWPELLADLERGHPQPRYGDDGEEFDLAEAPMPAFEALDVGKYNRLTVQTSRGCPHLCDFCASSVLLTKRYKQKPIGKVLAEIDRITSIWPHPFIEFADDNTFIHRVYWKELLNQLKDRRLRWFTETDISVADDPDLLELMRESGCAQVLIGLESPTESALDGIELKANWKYRQWSHYKDAIHEIQAHGIGVNGCFVVGLDGHDTGIFEQICEAVRELELQEVQVTLQTAFPGTPLYARLLDEGRLLEATAWKRCTLFDVNYHPARMSADELASGFRTLVTRLYDDEFTRWRRERFKEFLRAERSR